MYKFLKVVFDVLLALIALVCVSWLLLPCMLILWCTGEHKVWYLQKMGWVQEPDVFYF